MDLLEQHSKKYKNNISAPETDYQYFMDEYNFV